MTRYFDVAGTYKRLVRLSQRHVSIIATVGCALIAFVYIGELIQATTDESDGDGNRPYWTTANASPPTLRQVHAMASSVGVEFDVRNRVDVLAEMRERHLNPVPAVTIGGLLGNKGLGSGGAIDVNKLAPIGGISSSLTVLCNESGQYVTFESDEHGFRNPSGVWNQYHADLAVVGESFAQGYCVPDGKSFADLLRVKYPLTLNLGMSGESALLQLAAIREYLRGYMPKTVLWVYCEDIDIADLFEETKQPLLIRYLDPDFTQNLASRQNEIDGGLRRFVAGDEASQRSGREAPVESAFNIERGLSILKLWHLRSMLDAARATDEAQAVRMLEKWHNYPYAEIIQQAQALTHSWGGALYFVYLPSWRRYRHHAAATELEHTAILRMIKELQIPYIDLEPAFDATRDPLSLFPYRRFGHYNEEGNKLVADTILHVLANRETTH